MPGTSTSFAGTNFEEMLVTPAGNAGPMTGLFNQIHTQGSMLNRNNLHRIVDLASEGLPSPDGGTKALRIDALASGGATSRYQLELSVSNRTNGMDYCFSWWELDTGFNLTPSKNANNGTTFQAVGMTHRNDIAANGPLCYNADITARTGVTSRQAGLNLSGTTGNNGDQALQKGILGPLENGVWTFWEQHNHIAKDGSGLIEFFKNGVKVHQITGQNMQSGANYWRHRLGFYAGGGIDFARRIYIADFLFAPTRSGVNRTPSTTPTDPGTPTTPPAPTGLRAANKTGATGTIVLTSDAYPPAGTPLPAGVTLTHLAIRWNTQNLPVTDGSWQRIGLETDAFSVGRFTAPLSYEHVSGQPVGTRLFYYITAVTSDGQISAPSVPAEIVVQAATDSGAPTDPTGVVPIPAIQIDDTSRFAAGTDLEIQGLVTFGGGQARLTVEGGTGLSIVRRTRFEIDMTNGAIEIPIGAFGLRNNAGTGMVNNRLAIDWGNGNRAVLVRDTRYDLISATGVAATDIFTATAHGYVAGQAVTLATVTGGAGLTAGTTYYVIAANLAANTFQISATPGGAAVNFTTDVSASTFTSQTPTVDRWLCILRLNDVDIGPAIPAFNVADIAGATSPSWMKVALLADDKTVSYQIAGDTKQYQELTTRTYADTTPTAPLARAGFELSRQTGDVAVSQAFVGPFKGTTAASNPSSGGTPSVSDLGLSFSAPGQVRNAPLGDAGGLPLTLLFIGKPTSTATITQPMGVAAGPSTPQRHFRLYPASGTGVTTPYLIEMRENQGAQVNGQLTLPDNATRVMVACVFGSDGKWSQFMAPLEGANAGVVQSAVDFVTTTPGPALTSGGNPNARLSIGGSITSIGAALPGGAYRGEGDGWGFLPRKMTLQEFSSLLTQVGPNQYVVTRGAIKGLTGGGHFYEVPTSGTPALPSSTAQMVDVYDASPNSETLAERQGAAGDVVVYTSSVVATGVTGVTSTDTLTKAAHPLANGKTVIFSALTGGSGLVLGQRYYVINATTNTFQLAAAVGGTTAVDLGSDITAATLHVAEIPYDPAQTTAPTPPTQQVPVPQPPAPVVTSTVNQGATGDVTVSLVSPSSIAASGSTPAFTPNATPILVYLSTDKESWVLQGSAQSATTKTITGLLLDTTYYVTYRYRDNSTQPVLGDFAIPAEFVISSGAALQPVSRLALTGRPFRAVGGTAEVRVAAPPAEQSIDDYHLYLTPLDVNHAPTGAEFTATETVTLTGGEAIIAVTGLSDAVPFYKARLAPYRTEA